MMPIATFIFMPNAQGEPGAPLARSPASAGGVPVVLIGSAALFGPVSLFS